MVMSLARRGSLARHGLRSLRWIGRGWIGRGWTGRCSALLAVSAIAAMGPARAATPPAQTLSPQALEAAIQAEIEAAGRPESASNLAPNPAAHPAAHPLSPPAAGHTAVKGGTHAIAPAAALATPEPSAETAEWVDTSGSVVAQAGRLCMPQATQTINSIVNSSTFSGGRWGIRVEPLNDNTLLYEHASGNYYIPASNNKLYISAAALQLYDPRSPISSSTLGSWIQTILRNSDNGYADSLFRRLGGSAVVHRTLAQLGIDPNGYRMADGSGLSRQNATKAVTLVDLLQVMDDSAGADVFRASLPVAGSTGTLSRRFRGTPAQGQVSAKTGTLRGVRALSGYANNPYYGPLAFSILVNQPGQSGDRMLAAIDRIVLLLIQAQPCGADSLQVDPVTRPQPAPGRGLESLQEEIERLREEFRRSRQP